jgi:hypothetical protein
MKAGNRSFIYKIYRKVRFLKQRGTLLHKTPRNVRRKKNLYRRRTWRHILYIFRPVTFHRFRRFEKFKIQQFQSGPYGYESVSGRKMEFMVPGSPKKRLSFSEKYHRIIRITRYVRNKRKLYKKQAKITRKRAKRKTFRIFLYLLRTGKLFKIDYNAVRAFLDRNYSFLGKAKYFVIFLNSTVLFLLAYLSIYVVKEVTTAFVANSYSVKTVLYYYDLNFLIRSGDWTQDMIQVVFSAGPFMAFFICLISVVIYANTTYENWPIRSFIFWVMCISFVQFFGEVMLGSLLSRGFGWVIAYLVYLDTPKMVISLLGFICLVSAGLALTRYALYSGNIYFNKLDKKNRMPFMMSQVFLPFIMGTAIIIGIKQPKITQFEITVAISMILMLLPATIRARFFGTMYFDEDLKKIKVMWPWLIAALILIPAFRIIFGMGIRV